MYVKYKLNNRQKKPILILFIRYQATDITIFVSLQRHFNQIYMYIYKRECKTKKKKQEKISLIS